MPWNLRLERTADIVEEFVSQAGRLLSEEQPANMVLLRGWAQLPNLPEFGRVYRLNPAAIAAYPMYRGLASVASMRIIPTGMTFGDEVDTLHANWDDHDFFLHPLQARRRRRRGRRLSTAR